MSGLTVDPDKAIREYLSARIGARAVHDLDAKLEEVREAIENMTGVREHVFAAAHHHRLASSLSSEDQQRLCDAVVELCRGMYVRGHRFASGAAVSDDEHDGKEVSFLFEEQRSANKIRELYSGTADSGMRKGDRITHVMNETGASRATVYRAIAGLL